MKFLSLVGLYLAATTAYPGYDDGGGGGLRSKKPCSFASGLGAELSAELSQKHGRRLGENRRNAPPSSEVTDRRFLLEGLLNEGKGCWGACAKTAGDCAHCGTGQCCRPQDYTNGVVGCELADAIESGSRCGAWAGDPPAGLRNEGRACAGSCPDGFGADCAYCGGWDGVADGSGQCCRLVDAERGVPGCELAATAWPDPEGPAAQCGAFKDHNLFEGPSPTPPTTPTSPTSPTSPTPPTTPTTPTPPDGLMNEGVACAAPCGFTNDQWGPTRDCPQFCGTGTCCSAFDWRRGAPGCELAVNVTGGQMVCGEFRDEGPALQDFRTGMPRGVYPTSSDAVETGESAEGRWIKDIVVDGSNPGHHFVPEYNGEGGQPWSQFEMSLIRDLLVFQMRQATAGLDELSTAKFIRLPFHDCLHYEGEDSGSCDGCINWENVGFRHVGRVEERNYEDYERPSPSSSNNGLGDAIEFLEYIFTLDLGKTWASGCYVKPGAVSGANAHLAGTRHDPIWVSTVEECRDHCLNTTDCKYFTVPHLRHINANGPCRLFSGAGTQRQTRGSGRLIAGDAYCEADSWSLQSRGKSRADLWAFASLVAVEEGIQRHNWACDGDRRSPHNGPIMCTQFEGEDQCSIELPRPFVFKTGRKDCKSGSFMTDKKENSPDEHFNGTMAVRFMEDNFGFSAKETVTAMGAHTVGRFHQRQTGHKYVWTTDFQAFNNQYYRNIAGKEDWFFDDDECNKVGDAWGNKGHAVWIAKMNQVYRSGGPVQWIQKKVVCPNCAARSYDRGGRHPQRLAQDRDCCLVDVPEGAQCRPDGIGPIGSRAFNRDDDFSDGCEYSHFIFGRDEAAMGSDMGLRYKFDVDIRGFPYGCPGLETFYPSGFRFSDVICGIDGRPRFVDPSLAWNDPNLERVTKNDWTDDACPADCARQDYQYPGDSRTLADWVDLYADNQAAWIREYVPVMEKMINNGYDDGVLVTSFSGYDAASGAGAV